MFLCGSNSRRKAHCGESMGRSVSHQCHWWLQCTLSLSVPTASKTCHIQYAKDRRRSSDHLTGILRVLFYWAETVGLLFALTRIPEQRVWRLRPKPKLPLLGAKVGENYTRCAQSIDRMCWSWLWPRRVLRRRATQCAQSASAWVLRLPRKRSSAQTWLLGLRIFHSQTR